MKNILIKKNDIKQKVLGWLKLFFYLVLEGQDSPLLYFSEELKIFNNEKRIGNRWTLGDSRINQ